MPEILVVDDDDDVRSIIVGHLATTEARVVDVNDARSALKLVRSQTFDLIISDLFMPEVDGIKFITEVRRIRPSVPIILVTGGGLNFPLGSQNIGILAQTATILGASEILQKPFRGDQLRELVKSLIASNSTGDIA